jgi:integrase
LWQRYIRMDAGCPDLRVHDLRHTFGSYALEKGYTLDQIGEALNHSNPQTTKIYAELTDRSRQRIANDVSLGILADMKVADASDAYMPDELR